MSIQTGARRKSKRYEIYCVTKHDRNVFLHRVPVRERNLGYAKKMAHDIVAQRTHHQSVLHPNLPSSAIQILDAKRQKCKSNLQFCLTSKNLVCILNM